MAITEYKFLAVDEKDLQATLEDQMGDGFWLLPSIGMPTATDRGFSFTAGRGTHTSGTKNYKLLFSDDSASSPTAVIAVLNVPESEMDTEMAAVLADNAGAVLNNIWHDAKPSGEVTFDMIFYVFA